MPRGHGEKSYFRCLGVLECLLQMFRFLAIGSVPTGDFPLFLEKNVSLTLDLTCFSRKKHEQISLGRLLRGSS